MTGLDEVLAAARANPERAVFVSRAGADPRQVELAVWIGAALTRAGWGVILQDAQFGGKNFWLAMDAALTSRARVLALMSREYLDSPYCMAEATSALDDPMNSSGRLALLRIDDCQPMGVLRHVDHVDFIRVWRTGNAQEMERVLLWALERPADLTADYLVPAAVGAAQLLHREVLAHDAAAFTGRERDMERLSGQLWSDGAATLAGMGDVGKTTLARAYAFINRERYHGIWWLRAERTETLVEDLIDLGARFDAGLRRWKDLDAAARHVLDAVVGAPTDKPWLLVYDNAAGPGALRSWRPARNCHALITSRYPHWDSALPLDVLAPAAAAAFLCDGAGRRQERDRAEAPALAEQLGRLPLALAHAAAACRDPRLGFGDYGRRLAEFLDAHPDSRDRFGAYGRSVFATFSMALEDILRGDPARARPACAEAETVMGVLAHLAAEEVPPLLLAPLHSGADAAMSAAAFDRALALLTAAALLRWGAFEDGEPHLNLHRLAQEVMRARLRAAGADEAMAARTTRLIDSTFDESDSLPGRRRNLRWLPIVSQFEFAVRLRLRHSERIGPRRCWKHRARP